MEFLQPAIGEEVCVRRRRWTLRAAEVHPDCRVLTLQSISISGNASCRQVIQPFDDVQVLRTNVAPSRVGSRRWQSACRALLTEDGRAESLLTAATASIELLPFQLEPAMALLMGHGSRVLIADDVGLGKTVQAVLAVAELRTRGLVTRVLIVCPAGLRDQWADECNRRFALPFRVADQGSLRRSAAQLPHGVNPWLTLPLSIVSVDYVKRPEVLSAALSVPWDLVVVDEAHGSCGTSERQDAVAQLSARAPYVVLLTATPHNGDSTAFDALCAIGSHGDRLVVFRRSKREVGQASDRRIHVTRVTLTDQERRMHESLAALTHAIRHERVTSESHAWLVLSVLHKRALSGGRALAASVARRLALLGGGEQNAGDAQLGLPFTSDDDDGSDAPPMWSEPALHDAGREQALLDRVLQAATDAAGADSKLRFLKRLLARVREAVIVFTEYRDTLLHLRSHLGVDAAVIHGGLSRSERQSALARFRDCRLLLATDAAGEGLNLHDNCRTVINLELPWNPMRLEQRIGRVDRIGQQRRVHVVHLVAASTGEMRLLQRLVSRVRRAHRSIPSPNPFGPASPWTETDSARLVMLGEPTASRNRQLELQEDGGPAEPPPVREHVEPQIQSLRLMPESEREARRLSFVRRLRSRMPETVDDRATTFSHRPLIARSIRPKLRHVLGGGSLALYRVSVTDAHGRRVATRIMGVVTKTSSTVPEALLGADAAVVATKQLLMNATRDWFDETVATHANACSTHVERVASIVRFAELHPRIWQPGLFDRRVELERARDGAARSRARDEASVRLHRVEDAAGALSRTFELVLFAVASGQREQ